MANRVPLVIDASTNRIVELPVIDNLDLTGSNISSVVNINSTGNVTAINFIGDGGNLSNIVATVAQTVSNAAQPNITSVGTLSNLTVSGNLVPFNVVLDKFNETVVNGGNTGTATLTPDAAAGTIFQYTLTGNITINALANAVAGTSVTLILTQDNTGNKTLTSSMRFAGGSKTLSTTANTTDIITCFFDGTTYYASLTKGYV